jgi:para-aminobenzoate synthetase / 4-amino-4-deoxychorismate lyase
MPGERPDPARGVFETLLIVDGRLPALSAHLARLEHSVHTLYGLPLPDDARGHLATAAAGAPGEGRARLDAVPADGRLALSVTVSAAPVRAPVALTPVVIPGGLGTHKWRDRRLVETGNGATPLIVDADGRVLEAGWGNVWTLDGDTLTTPPLDGRILPGVTRARLIDRAPGLGLQIREAPITLEQARATTTLFLTSSLRLAVPAGLGRPPGARPEVDRIARALGAP